MKTTLRATNHSGEGGIGFLVDFWVSGWKESGRRGLYSGEFCWRPSGGGELVTGDWGGLGRNGGRGRLLEGEGEVGGLVAAWGRPGCAFYSLPTTVAVGRGEVSGVRWTVAGETMAATSSV